MSSNIIIFLGGILSIIGIYTIYKNYKYFDNVKYNGYPKLKYKVFETHNYKITNSNCVHHYDAKSSSFTNLSKLYKDSLYENPIKNMYVDEMIFEYLQKNHIEHKTVIIETNGWIAKIHIENNTKNTNLIFKLLNDTLNNSMYHIF